MIPEPSSRRSFFKALGAALIAVTAFPARGWPHAPRRKDALPLTTELRELLGGGGAATLGAVCLKLPECLHDQATLIHLIGVEPGQSGEAQLAALVSRIENDFECGATVRVDGWVLARTEARLYALAALVSTR